MMPKGSLNFEEMAALVKKAAERYESLQFDASVSKRTGCVTLRWEGVEDHWVKIELGIEAFFFEVDRGYQAVAFEYSAPEQSELLEEFRERRIQVPHRPLRRQQQAVITGTET